MERSRRNLLTKAEVVISEMGLLYIKNSVYDKDILRASPVAQR